MIAALISLILVATVLLIAVLLMNWFSNCFNTLLDRIAPLEIGNQMSDIRLRVFFETAKLLNFTKAAEVLHMTQPAVSFHIRQLEDRLNVSLFDRTSRRVSLTDAGLVVFEHSKRILEQYNEMENAILGMTNDELV